MYIGIAILTDTKIHNVARNIVLNLNQKYGMGIESALLPQHISLKQSFPYEGDIKNIEKYLEIFCSNLKPMKVLLEKVEINIINEDTILGWIKVKESRELRDIHRKLCKELKSHFNVEPLGFDGDEWTFHTTLAVSKVNKNLINKIFSEYNNKDMSIEFEARKVAMFCNVGDSTKISDYFSLKIFDIDKDKLPTACMTLTDCDST